MSTSTAATAKPTIIYDGECRFCVQRVKSLKGWDTDHCFAYLPRQDEQSETQFPQIAGINLDDGLLFVQAGDAHVYVAADAVYQIFRRLPRFRVLAWLYLVPGLKQVIQLGYRLIAINRRRLGQVCKDGVCKIEDHH